MKPTKIGSQTTGVPSSTSGRAVPPLLCSLRKGKKTLAKTTAPDPNPRSLHSTSLPKFQTPNRSYHVRALTNPTLIGRTVNRPTSPTQFFLQRNSKNYSTPPPSRPPYKSRQHALHLRHAVAARRCRCRLRPHRSPRQRFPVAAAAPLSTFSPGPCCQEHAWRGEVGLCGGPVASRRWCGCGGPGGSVRRDPCHRRPHVRRQDHRAPPPGPGRGRQRKVRNAGDAVPFLPCD